MNPSFETTNDTHYTKGNLAESRTQRSALLQPVPEGKRRERAFQSLLFLSDLCELCVSPTPIDGRKKVTHTKGTKDTKRGRIHNGRPESDSPPRRGAGVGLYAD